MKTIKNKIDWLKGKILTDKIKEEQAIKKNDNDGVIYYTDNIALYDELIRDLTILDKFIRSYSTSTYDENKNKIVLELDCNTAEIQEIENYFSDYTDI